MLTSSSGSVMSETLRSTFSLPSGEMPTWIGGQRSDASSCSRQPIPGRRAPLLTLLMTALSPPARTWGLTAKTVGALAVVGLVIAFSLSSTLVKRAESPGVLVAFWRMVAVAGLWNVYLWMTGRRVTMRHVRQAFVPGVFFGLNLAAFFSGATQNSVANAALIGSLAPFLIVPVGARLFREYFNARALLFALLAFGGAAMVLLNAPPRGTRRY